MKIALIGNPNAGKSSIFNHLTGLRQKTGNFPGVTVDKRTGRTRLPNGNPADVIDLPGAYSLYPNAADERVVADTLCNRNSGSFPDVVVYVADANNLERHLLLCTQLIDLKIPVAMALTMTDLSEKNGLFYDYEELSESLGISVTKVNGRTGDGIQEMLKAVLQNHQKKAGSFISVKHFSPNTIDAAKEIVKSTDISDYAALLTAHHYKNFSWLNKSQKSRIEESIRANGFSSIRLQVQETLARYDKINFLLKKISERNKLSNQESFTEKVDSLLTHKIFGSLIFLSILFLLFQAIFSWAAVPMEWIDVIFSNISLAVKQHLPAGIITDLFAEGIIPGLAGIFIFIPQIAILFAVIVFLEDIGYMSRAIFLSDSIMRKFGLNGRSMLPLFSGLACAVPAIMATRTITNWKERLTTIMITPLISCSARIPVYTILIALAIPADAHVGFFNLQGLVMTSLYILGIAAALATALVLKKIVKTNEQSFLLMELPSYKSPHWKNILLSVFDKVKIFVTQAGKVIMVISIILWFLASYGPGESMKLAEQQAGPTSIASKKLEASYAGHLGRLIEPVIQPLGFDWKIGIALITSFAAREVFVGTVSTLYSIGDDSNQTVISRLRNEINPETGQPSFTTPVAVSLLIFYVFAMQCMSTFAVVKRETKSWKWPVVQTAYMTALAYLGSWTAYQVMTL